MAPVSSMGSLGGLGLAGGMGGAGSPLATRQADFSSILARAGAPAAGQTAAEGARDAAEQFVSITLVQPLLADLRKSNGAAAPFAPSRGEQQFQTLMDAHVAHQVVKAAHFPLVDRLARQLLSEVSQSGAAAGAAEGQTT